MTTDTPTPLPANLFHLRQLARALLQGWRGPLRPLLKPTVWKIAVAFAIVPLFMSALLSGVINYGPMVSDGVWQALSVLARVVSIAWPAAVVAWATRMIYRRAWADDAQMRLLPITPHHRLTSVLGTLIAAHLLQAIVIALLWTPLVLFQGGLPMEDIWAEMLFHTGKAALHALGLFGALEQVLILLVATLSVLAFLARTQRPTLPQTCLAALAPILAVEAAQFLLCDLASRPFLLRAFGPFFTSPRLDINFSVKDVLQFQAPYLVFQATFGLLSLLLALALLQLAFYPRLLARARGAFTAGDLD